MQDEYRFSLLSVLYHFLSLRRVGKRYYFAFLHATSTVSGGGFRTPRPPE